MVRDGRGEDVTAILDSLAAEAEWVRTYYVPAKVITEQVKASRSETERELGRTTGMGDF